MDTSWDLRVQAVAVLEEPTRRRLYEYVVGRPAPVGRDEAATALGIPRTTAAFHLDKLTEEGLLDTCYERRTGRTGPGAGRPAKLYHRSDREIEITLPERHYAIAGHLLAAAIQDAESGGLSAREAANRQARRYGEALGRTAAKGAAGDTGDVAGADRGGGKGLVEVLATQGFEPRADADSISLANCPFRRLAREFPQLVCGMNVELLRGLLDGYGDTGLRAVPDPQPTGCCVRLVSSEGGKD